MTKHRVLAVALVLLSISCWAQYKIPAKMEWWHEARFGMFIHFGSYSHLERGEWVFSTENWAKWPYQQQCSAQFNPDKFDAAQIAQMAKNAGMKYLTITAKHHEGFAMWDTKVASFKDSTGAKIYSLQSYTPVKRDILMELKKACEKRGIKFCLYYSILDWNHKSQRISKGSDVFSKMESEEARSAYITDMKLQLKELIDRYDPYVLWFDGDWCPNPAKRTLSDWWTSEDGADLYKYLTDINPKLIVNERIKRHTGIGDFECPEQRVPESPMPRLWETCATLNGAWGCDRSRDTTFRSSRELIAEMMKAISRDGNYLLNIGPRADGSIDKNTAKLLEEIGAWTKKYAKAVYGVERNPFGEYSKWGDAVRHGDYIYLVLSGEPTQAIEMPASLGRFAKANMLGTGKRVESEISDGKVILRMPHDAYSGDEIKVVAVRFRPKSASNGK